MCCTTWHHNITQTHIDKGSEEPHSFKYKQGSHDPSFRAYKQRKHYMSEYRQLQKKRAEKPDYLQVPPKVQDRSWANKLLVEVQEVLLVRQMSHLQNINKANVSTKVLSKTYIKSYHTSICIKKVMWGLVAASQLWLSGYPVLRQRETSLRWGSAHESTNHHINTLLWIHSRLLTRRPSIALTLVLSILEYPLQVFYVPRKHPRSP